MNLVEDFYDNKYDEWSRLDRHRIEFEITKKYLDKFIVGDNLDIFDIGGGPGRYSFYLSDKGHNVTLLDLSQHNIDIAKEKSKELNTNLAGYIKGDALELDEHNKKYDVVLLMGPLYHLVNKADRRKALKGAVNLLKDGGIIVASFISNYAPIQDNFAYLKFDNGEDDVRELLGYIESGVNNVESGFTTAYFSSSEEALKLMEEYNLKQLAFAGVENILGCRERDILLLPEEDIQKWIRVGFALGEDKKLLGASQHYLYIGRK
ncbi:class I SAM-dependent methyltransferase [Sedimentibacter sp. zth1]|uniref:class I SAM-dependent methyltransferase n=1 Tax=Sedimentibacter sp. zth1 TaxID=2816908 RepID=UPI001A9317EA|nr:class I SAM-dependent methyltransferase [Sedimentibacter sp. zth1]QSX06110.1 class I SAM-dependent methyltransferase [Sedimentibacter sp. zth1]